ncbi:efflux RND transporter periplasmic adaptor subunit [Belnapia rosea]|uniref:RND family efflux transporter, MFP subunit n=1 Tax=Belnapia rosea TaxID=938405 RepID=A0A1G6SKD5_9PROT|nr:efflux RND transporter periplasmic adaptor subunit [Belnapia rosea]SDB61513.1 RND family efflux transporter, MFP subunit [Belnapia rosea]SDD17101.1 RND family efflux transporter, MFP subunit [Belnapia rosea]
MRIAFGAPFVARALAPLLLLVPLLAHAAEPAPNEVQIRIDERQYRAAGIEITRVEAEAGTTQTILPGTVSVPPQQLRVVAAPAAGLVEAVLVAPNEPVKAGQPIARLRSTDLLEAQRTYLQALSAERLAAEKLRRDEQMHRERIIAERRLLTTRADYDYARTTLQEREQMLALLGMAEVDIRAVRDQRRMVPALTVSAPADGVVLEVRTTAGERIAPAAPLFSIAQLDPLWITLQLPLAQANAIVPGTRVAVPGTPAQGEVVRLGRSVDPNTQSLAAVVEVSDGAEALRPGQVVSASVALRPNGTPQWRLPSGSVVRHAGQSWVFVRSSQGFRARPVVVIAETASTVSIRASLTAEDQVATRGILSLLAELTEVYGG